MLGGHCFICIMIAIVGTLQRLQTNCGERVCDHHEAAFLLYNFTNQQAPLQYSLVMSYIAFFGALFTLCMSSAWEVSTCLGFLLYSLSEAVDDDIPKQLGTALITQVHSDTDKAQQLYRKALKRDFPSFDSDMGGRGVTCGAKTALRLIEWKVDVELLASSSTTTGHSSTDSSKTSTQSPGCKPYLRRAFPGRVCMPLNINWQRAGTVCVGLMYGCSLRRRMS
jgi:hypothetical protein